jgi:heat shock protein HtpX
MVERLAMKSGIKIPKLGIAQIALPNAFAYGSPITGNHLAVTRGLLETLEEEEIEAVVAHELGHLKHRDVQIMMIISFLPSLFYLIGRSVMFSAYYGERRRDGGSYVVGTVSMLVYFILMLFTLRLSRLREYYADSHSISIIDDGPRKLSEGLAKIVLKTRTMRRRSYLDGYTFNSFKSLFISDPDRAEFDSAQMLQYQPQTSDRELVGRILERRVTSADVLLELFSTHPNITKRLRAIQVGT